MSNISTAQQHDVRGKWLPCRFSGRHALQTFHWLKKRCPLQKHLNLKRTVLGRQMRRLTPLLFPHGKREATATLSLAQRLERA